MDGSSLARVLERMWLLMVAMLAIAVLYLAKVLFLPLAFAILFAFLLAPVVGCLERARLGRVLSSVIAIVGFGLILGVMGWAIFSQLVDVTNDLPYYRDNISNKIAAIHSPDDSPLSRAQQELERLGEELGIANSTASLPSTLSNGRPDNKNAKKPLGSTPEHPIQVREVERPTGRLYQLGGVLEPLTTAGLTIIFTFFVTLQREDLRNRLIRLTGERNLTMMTQAMRDASRRITRYFSLQLLVNIAFGCIICAGLYLIGLPHPLLFGALATLLRFVPYIGAPVAAAIPTVLSLAVFPEWTKSLLIVGLFFVLELVTGNYAEPRIYGKHTGLSSLAILVAAAFWTLIWGPVGLILSVPLTVCLVVIGSHVPALEFLNVLLGDQPAIPQSTCFYQRLLARDEREAGEILETCLKDSELNDVYDGVLIPALVLSEEDRMQGDVEEPTIRYIRTTARDLIEEIGFRDNAPHGTHPASKGHAPDAAHESVRTLRVSCIPIRDEVDELGAMMLAQVLSDDRVKADAAPVRRLDEILASVASDNPDVVFLCGLPPLGIARSHRIYRTLRARHPKLRIMIGIWSYADDPNQAAQKISGGEEARVMTRLTEAAAEVRSFLGAQPAPYADTAATNEAVDADLQAVGALPDQSAA